MTIAILAAALGAGLMAGLFFTFSTFVMRALASLPPAPGAAAMKAINVFILNPVFLVVFLGTGVTGGVAAVLSVARSSPRAPYLLAGALLYLLGVLGVTFACNVPRNNALAAVEPGSPAGAQVWAGYVPGWTRWNHVRTLAALAATAAFTLALRS